ncbi:site-specific integrase [Morganella morganii]
MARNRNTANKGLPPNLYLRNGYYSYRDPRTRKEYGLGRNRTLAITEAIQANIELFGNGQSLMNKINSESMVTLGAWCKKYDCIIQQRGIKQVTIQNKRGLLKLIPDNLKQLLITDITVKDIACLISDIVDKGAAPTAKLLRSELMDLFREAMADGLISVNPAEGTRNPKTTVTRSRLSFDEYMQILSQAESTHHAWFVKMMKVALITGQRQSDLCSMHWDNIYADKLHVIQSKTGVRISIPLDIRIAGMRLIDIIGESGSGYVFASPRGNAPNKQLARNYFQQAREKTGLSWEGTPPSFHEIRSLSARLYSEERGVDFAKQLLGHKSIAMTEVYRDNRGDWNEILL